MRINAVHIKSNISAQMLAQERVKEWREHFSDKQLIQAILYSKSKQWDYEKEIRITYPLSTCKLKVKSDSVLTSIYCAEIPFSAFKNVYLGYAISPEDREAVVNSIQHNCELSHVTIFEACPCPTGALKKRIVS